MTVLTAIPELPRASIRANLDTYACNVWVWCVLLQDQLAEDSNWSEYDPDHWQSPNKHTIQQNASVEKYYIQYWGWDIIRKQVGSQYEPIMTLTNGSYIEEKGSTKKCAGVSVFQSLVWWSPPSTNKKLGSECIITNVITWRKLIADQRWAASRANRQNVKQIFHD